MNKVETIKDISEVLQIAKLLKKSKGTSIYADLWLFCWVTGFRINEILNLKKEHYSDGVITSIRGSAKIELVDPAKAILERRIKHHPSDIYLFQSSSNRTGKTIKPVSRQAIAKALMDVTITEQFSGRSISMHSARKGYAYRQYKETADIAKLRKFMKHSSAAVTLKYIDAD
jgi:integrase